jgi:hypothetical protein
MSARRLVMPSMPVSCKVAEALSLSISGVGLPGVHALKAAVALSNMVWVNRLMAHPSCCE